MTETCPICSRVRPRDMFVCRECVTTARTHLVDIAEFSSWADEKRARMGSRIAVGRSSPAAETPLPYDPRVSRVLVPIHNALTGWARIAWDEGADPATLDGTQTHHVARWLVDYCETIGTRDYAPDAFRDFDNGAEGLRNLFDRPPDKVYLGRCNADVDPGPCPESIYVDASQVPERASCPRCATDIVVEARRAELAQGVENYLGTARELSRLLSLVLGEHATQRMIWAYSKHGLIQSKGTRVEYDTRGVAHSAPLYRIGEVREAATMLDQDEDARRAVKRTIRGEGKALAS